jgi:hypothetical protein
MFRVSRRTYDNLRNNLCNVQPFFRCGFDATKREKISTDAKILIALKYLAYGTTVSAFRDYFQIGESTAIKCVKIFCKEMTTSPFRQEYFRSMAKGDAKRVEALHAEVHGVRGMIGSLDCSHFVWGNCPVAHHGQYQGKEGEPTLVVEAMVDYTLYAWHAVFGYCGTLNYVIIWDNSLLLQAMCDGTFDDLDFPFSISGEDFQQLWMLVDSSYPPISRFVKPISVPLSDVEALFSLWQESKRKDVERFFGVFIKKFHLFAKPVPFAYILDVLNLFYCCLILHNMAVCERIEAGQQENDGFYDCIADDVVEDNAQNEPRFTPALQLTNMQEDYVMERALEIEYLSALGINVVECTLALDLERITIIPQYQRVAQYRWNQLYNSASHLKLSKAIVRELKSNYNKYKKEHKKT